MLPKAVREQAERAEALQERWITGNTATPAAVETPPTEAPTATQQAGPVETPATVVETPATSAVASSSEADPWELRYKVLNGKYTAEVPRLAAQNRELAEELRVAKAALEQRGTQAPASDGALTPDLVREQYGDDFANAVDAIASNRSKTVNDELAAIRADTARMARSEFIRTLGSQVPNWQTVDSDPGFTAYLDEFDPQSGRQRREFFNEADGANDALRVANFFSSYERSIKRAVVQAPPPPAAAPSVDHLIAPSSSRHSEAPPGKKLWTKAEVVKFYADARPSRDAPTGRFTSAEYARLDADISAASNEGRYLG